MYRMLCVSLCVCVFQRTQSLIRCIQFSKYIISTLSFYDSFWLLLVFFFFFANYFERSHAILYSFMCAYMRLGHVWSFPSEYIFDVVKVFKTLLKLPSLCGIILVGNSKFRNILALTQLSRIRIFRRSALLQSSWKSITKIAFAAVSLERKKGQNFNIPCICTDTFVSTKDSSTNSYICHIMLLHSGKQHQIPPPVNKWTFDAN